MNTVRKKSGNGRKKYELFYVILIFLIILFLSFGFSSFQNSLYIDDIEAIVRIDKDIRVSGVSVSSVNDAISTYEDYNASSVKSKVNLYNRDSYIIYNVDVYNLGNVIMGIREININYDNLKVEVLNYDLKSKLCEENKCVLGIKRDLQIKVSYKEGGYSSDNTSYDIFLDFLFGKIYNIDYYDLDSTDFPKEIIEGEKLNIKIPSRGDYLLKVAMNNKILSIDNDYQYSNDILSLSNINGDIQIYFKLPVCQRATILHTEECFGFYCVGMGYTADGSMGTTTITYGSIGVEKKLSSGDAFDCDVNGDGVYDSSVERFYYVTDIDDDVVSLIYYNNVSAGKPSSDKFYPYDNSSENWHGPRSAIEQLPTVSQWKNVSLVNSERVLKNEIGNNVTNDGYTFPSVFSYAKYAARLLTIQELRKVLKDVYIPSWNNGELNNYLYLMENTNFSKKSNINFDGYWLENPRYSLSQYAWIVYGTARRVHSVEVSRSDVLGVRPVIELNKSDILY